MNSSSANKADHASVAWVVVSAGVPGAVAKLALRMETGDFIIEDGNRNYWGNLLRAKTLNG